MPTNHLNKPHLQIDHREKSSQLFKTLQSYTHNFTIETTHLKSGDYLLNNTILFERKTIADFLASLKSGRLFDQAYRLINSDYDPIIIIEGAAKNLKESKMKREALLGALVHIAVSTRIPVLRSASHEETARLLAYTAKQFNRDAVPQVNKPVIKKTGFRLTKQQKDALATLQNLPGIGTTRAIALMKEFGTLHKLFNAKEKELLKVEGIGGKIAKNIIKQTNTSFF